MITPRIESSGKSTGFALESTSGTHETLTASNYVGMLESTPINKKQTNVKFNADGNVGYVQQINTASYGELSTLKLPFNHTNSHIIMQAAGCKYSSTALTYGFGGTYSSGVISGKTITIDQYDSQVVTSIYGGLASSLKLSAKVGEAVMLEAGIKGKYLESASSISFFQTPDSTSLPYLFTGVTSTLNSVSYDLSDMEIDFGLTLTDIKSATDSTGFAGFEITNIQPKITLTAYPGSGVTFETLWASDASFPVSIAFGKVIITSTCKVDSSEYAYSEGLKNNKIVLTPLVDTTSNTTLLFTFSA